MRGTVNIAMDGHTGVEIAPCADRPVSISSAAEGDEELHSVGSLGRVRGLHVSGKAQHRSSRPPTYPREPPSTKTDAVFSFVRPRRNIGGVPAYEVRSEVESPPVLIPLEKPRGVSEQQRGTYRPTLQLRRGVRQVDGGDNVDASSQRKEKPQAAEGRAA